MKIEEGKRYIRRDGTLSGVIYSNASGIPDLEFPFRDKTETYNPSGQCWYTNPSELDLIAEYKEQEMKEIDFTKPLYFEESGDRVAHVGPSCKGGHVVQFVGSGSLFVVDKFGRSESYKDLKNIP